MYNNNLVLKYGGIKGRCASTAKVLLWKLCFHGRVRIKGVAEPSHRLPEAPAIQNGLSQTDCPESSCSRSPRVGASKL
jgi:hypothetical protein